MRALFNFHPKQNPQRTEQTYLLIVALLNFEHEVIIIFHNNSFNELTQNKEQLKKWQALTLYGAQEFLHFKGDNSTIEWPQLELLMQNADFIA